jgi:hypothetical protein
MNTQTQEIPRNQWNSFFEIFSRQHEGWLATLEIFGKDLGAQEEAHELPLEGVSLTSVGNEAEAISIDLGSTAEDHVSHAVIEPARVWLEQTTEGANAALEIEAADGTQTLLRFRSSLPSEMVDGVVLE